MKDRNIIPPRIRSIGRTRNVSEPARLSQGVVKLLLHGRRGEQLVGQGPFHHAILGGNKGEEWTAYPYDMDSWSLASPEDQYSWQLWCFSTNLQDTLERDIISICDRAYRDLRSFPPLGLQVVPGPGTTLCHLLSTMAWCSEILSLALMCIPSSCCP